MSYASSVEDNTLVTNQAEVVERNSLYLTADERVPMGNPCVSNTRKKMEGDLSVQATKGSREASPACSANGDMMSLEQLRFTTVTLPRAMSKGFSSLLSGCDPIQTRPSVYRGSKESSFDGWILVMRRQHLQRTHAKRALDYKTWSIICHLEGEARNYITRNTESESETPEKVFELLASRFGTVGMQVRQAFVFRCKMEKEDWMQYLDAVEEL